MRIAVDEAVRLLVSGKVIAVPTETVYGLAAIATNPEAVSKIFEIKNRPADNPLICHFYGVNQIEKFASSISENTRLLLKKFSPGPISYMMDIPEDSLLKFATCGRSQVIARIPNHTIFLSIIEKVNAPIAAPSANTSGKISPTSVEMVEKDLGEKISGVVDGGTSQIGLESTIVDARSPNEIFLLRPGAIGEKEIQQVLPNVIIHSSSKIISETIPGTKYRHYAPDTPVYLIPDLAKIFSKANAAILLTREQLDQLPEEQRKLLQEKNISLINMGSPEDLNEAAQHFYQRLSSIDQLHVSKAFTLKTGWGNSSLGKAIQNRLEKIILDYSE